MENAFIDLSKKNWNKLLWEAAGNKSLKDPIYNDFSAKLSGICWHIKDLDDSLLREGGSTNTQVISERSGSWLKMNEKAQIFQE